MSLRSTNSFARLAVAAALLAAPVDAPAEAPLVVAGYEIKFSVDASKTLVGGGVTGEPELSGPVAKLFAVKNKAGKPMAIHFLDDCQRTLTEGGWATRIRDKDGKWELTYKRRYPATPDVEAALRQARKDGFTSHEEQKVEVDVAGERRTLSLSVDKALPPAPKPDAFVVLATEKPPATLPADMLSALKAAQVYGPIPARRWKGTLPGSAEEVEIEAWSLGGTHIVELSSKAKDAQSAEKRRAQLQAVLKKENLGGGGEVLKTEAVFAAFKPAVCK